MPRFVVVTREKHGAKSWRRPDQFHFAAADALAPALGAELSRLAPAMPLAFVELAGRFEMAAVLSLKPGVNMFVGPDGQWLSGYTPAFYRAYPFRLHAREEGADDAVLCVDEDSHLVVDRAAGGEAFFDADGNPSQAVKGALAILSEVERSRNATRLAVAALSEAGVIQPWPIRQKTAGEDQAVGGLYRIDEAAMNALDDDAFLRLRKASALPVAYAQILSVGQLGVFEHLAKIRAQLTPRPLASLPESLDAIFGLQSGDVVRFE